MRLLNSVDLVIIGSYMLAITLIGARFYRKKSGMQEYLLGSGGMRWFPVALSILAADTSALTYLGTPAWSFQVNMKLNLSILAYLFAVPLVIWLFLPIYSRGNLFTAYQYLERRFDLRVRLAATLFFLLLRGAHVALIIYAPALMMAELMGMPLKVSILAMGILTAFYTALGGVKGVIWTDTIQVGVVYLGFAIVAVTALAHIPGGLREVYSMGSAAGKFDLFDFSFNLNRIDNFWAMAIGNILLGVQAMGTDQAVLQKYFTTKSQKETAKSLLFYGLFTIPSTIFLSIIGIILFVLYAHRPDLRTTLQNPDALVPHYAAKVLPHGLAGLVVASIFAGSMSTVSASLNSLATSSVVDIYKRMIKPHGSDLHYTFASRWATALWGMLATLSAFYADRLGSLITSFAKVQSLLGGVILGIFLLGICSKRANGTGAIVGAVAGSAAAFYVSVYTLLSMYWYCLIGCAVTCLVGWLSSNILWLGPGYGRMPGGGEGASG